MKKTLIIFLFLFFSKVIFTNEVLAKVAPSPLCSFSEDLDKIPWYFVIKPKVKLGTLEECMGLNCS